jgi:hypothetical protein
LKGGRKLSRFKLDSSHTTLDTNIHLNHARDLGLTPSLNPLVNPYYEHLGAR